MSKKGSLAKKNAHKRSYERGLHQKASRQLKHNALHPNDLQTPEQASRANKKGKDGYRKPFVIGKEDLRFSRVSIEGKELRKLKEQGLRELFGKNGERN